MSATSVSFAIVGTAAIFGIYKYNQPNYGFQRACFAIIFIHSVVSAYRYGQVATEELHNFRETVENVKDYFVLPCLFSHLVLHYDYPVDLIYSDFILMELLFIYREKQKIKTSVVVFNSTLISLVSILNSNYFALCAVVVNFLTHLAKINFFETVNTPNMTNYIQCIFMYFTWKAMSCSPKILKELD